MPDLWLSPRGPQLATLEYRYEKAGLTIAREPIPWNAEAVLVEAVLRDTGDRRCLPRDFLLRLAGSRQSFSPLDRARLTPRPRGERGRGDDGPLTFRLPPPTQRTTVELLWKDRSLGQMTLPVLTRAAFVRGLAVELATPAARLGEHIVPCQTYVSSQCQELLASAVLTSPTALAPIVDLEPRVEFGPERGASVAPAVRLPATPGGESPAPRGAGQEMSMRLTGAQLAEQRALVTVGLRKPRRVGAWQVTWRLDGRILATQRLRAVSKPQFVRSLRVVDTRLIVQTGNRFQLLSHRPSGDVDRLGPCFIVRSAEPGMAGLCSLEIRARVESGEQPPPLWVGEMLISDGPTPVAPGTWTAGEWEAVNGFELRAGNRILGVVPLAASPAAHFNSEGGFQPAEPFLWNDFADQELRERLNRLLS
jgi:hypothetical protein